MLKLRSITILALLQAIAHACPYLAREHDREGKRPDNAKLLRDSARRTQEVNVSTAESQPLNTSETIVQPLNTSETVAQPLATPTTEAGPVLNAPTTVVQAVRIATAQIKRIIADIEGMQAKFVRLSFHDCVGGCDGCVDVSSPSNFGLHIPIDILDPVVQHNKQFLTTGDVWALAGLVATRVSQKDTALKFPLQFVGRPHCEGGATKAGPPRVLPSAHFTTKRVVSFFRTTFNFSADETTALLGAHTLGFAASANSGFTGEGGWDGHPDRLDNEYYKELLKFEQFTLTFEENAEFPPFPDQFYWEEEENGESGNFMLHADMALAFDMEGYLNPANGAVNCTIVRVPGQKLCPLSPLRARARLYSNQNTRWVRDFEAVFLKMVNTGCGNGVCTATEYCNRGTSTTCDGKRQGGGGACHANQAKCANCGGFWCAYGV